MGELEGLRVGEFEIGFVGELVLDYVISLNDFLTEILPIRLLRIRIR